MNLILCSIHWMVLGISRGIILYVLNRKHLFQNLPIKTEWEQ